MAAGVSTPVRGGGSKLAATVAERIVADVIAAGWPVGAVFGSEADLLARYGVSRAVFREAVRLVEHQQVATTRRGPGGGLVITEPTIDAVITAAVLYLHAVDAPLDEVFEARIALEETATEWAAARLTPSGADRVREATRQEASGEVRDPRALHVLVASLAGNPALELFVEVFSQVAMLYSRDWRSMSQTEGGNVHRAHLRVVEAVLDGSGELGRRRMRRHLEAEADFLRRRRSTRQLLPDDAVLGDADSHKRAELVARAIAQGLVAAGSGPGHLLGTETDLMDQHHVSRAVLREAVRILEHHHVAVMRRGPGGGLFVAVPSPAAVTEIAAIYLARRNVTLADLSELRTAVEVVLADLAANRIDAGGAARLDEALVREATVSEAERAAAVHDLHATIASVADNRALELVALVLIRLSRIHQIERLAGKRRAEIRDEVLKTHHGIADAVKNRDPDLARRRMRRHLDALARFIS